jgi:hypothetical protein
MEQINLTIDITSKETIQISFDRIAQDLILNWQLKINDILFSFTEIEFYYFYKGIHEDNATHEHNYEQGSWRFHNQGLDITFQSTDISDGGILIRGLKSENKSEKEYVNGPRRILETIFKNLNPVAVIQQQFGLSPKIMTNSIEIFKTGRHGISTTQKNLYSDALYRYYIDLAGWKNTHVSLSEKAKIKLKSLRVEI